MIPPQSCVREPYNRCQSSGNSGTWWMLAGPAKQSLCKLWIHWTLRVAHVKVGRGDCGAGAAHGPLQRGRAWQRTEQGTASTGGREPEPGFSLGAFQCFKEMELPKKFEKSLPGVEYKRAVGSFKWEGRYGTLAGRVFVRGVQGGVAAAKQGKNKTLEQTLCAFLILSGDPLTSRRAFSSLRGSAGSGAHHIFPLICNILCFLL